MKNIFVIAALLLASLSSFATPSVPANNLTFTTIGLNSLSFTWTRGNGYKCLVTVRPSASGVTHPSNGFSEYVTSTNYGSGAYLGTNTYCVYKGTGTSLTVSGLSTYTQYTISIYEYDNEIIPFIPYTYLTSPYETGPHYTITTQPVTQASALTSSSITTSGATLSWTSGSGVYELISVKQSTSNTNVPTDGNAYTASTTFGSGSALGASSPYSYVTYISSGTSVVVSGCSPATNYVANCFTYDGLSGGQNYNTSGYPTEGFTTLAAQPTGNCNFSYFTDVTENAMTVHWMRPVIGAGSNVLVTMRASAAADLPIDQNNYTASSTFGNGSLIGSSYVVYVGTGNTIRVTGLTTNTRYYIAIVEYNGGVGTFNPSNNYCTSYATGNQWTLPTEPITDASNLIFSNVQTNQVTASWTNGNGNNRVVGVRPSRIQTALAFDGTDDYVNVPYNSALQPTSAVTLDGWAYQSNWSTISGCKTIAGNYNSSGYGLFICNSSAYAYVYRNGSTTNPSTDITYLTPGWHHFALSYDGRNTVLYIDGAKKAENDAGASYPIGYPYANNFCIGVQSGTGATPNGNYNNGYIDEVRVWNVANSITTIRSNMNKSMLGNETGLVAAWNLNNGFVTSSVASNSSLNSTTLQGTLTNFASTVAATSFTGTSGWIKSGAIVDLPVDFTYYSPNTSFNNGTQIGTKYHSVYWGSGSSVTVTGLTPGTYYDFVVVEDNYNGSFDNYQTSTYLMGDVQTTPQPVPTITSFSPTSGTVGTLVTITGTNFDLTASNNIVYFGATKATVISATAVQLTVLVPYCANYVPISVSVNSVSGISRNSFVVTNACSATISGASFSASANAAGAARAGTAAKDIDGDGKSDFIYSDYLNNNFYVVRNLSSNGAMSWGTTYNFSTNISPLYLATGDVDGDNKPDIAVGCYGSGGATIDIFRNTSSSGSVTFANKVQLPSLASPTMMRLADFDNDGKLDLVVGHLSGGVVSVYRNTSSKGFISFDNRLDLPALGDSYTVEVGDMNGDGKNDVIVGDRTNNNVSFFQNTSTVGTLSCAVVVNLAPGSSPQSVAVGDMDNDGKPDLCTGLSNGTIRVYKNNNAGGVIASGNFSLQTTLTALNSNPYGLAINDLDGDTRNDLICGYSLSSSISLFEQTGTFIFSTKVDFTGTGTTSYFLCADDFSMDGKTDIANANFASTYTVYNSLINALAAEPVGASSVINIAGITQTAFNISFTAGGGTNRIVVVKPSSIPQVFPADGVGYSFNNDYTLAPDLGGGNKIVYNGSSNSVSVSGLSSNTTYNVLVYEYNGATCTANYLTNPIGSNTANTLNTPPALSSISSPSDICENSGQQSIGLTGIGTGAGNEIQTLVVTASSSNTTLIPNGNITVTYTSPNAIGTVSFTPASNQSGSSVITVTVNDGASNNNTTQTTFTVTVIPSPTSANAGSNVSICASATSLAGNVPVNGTGEWSFVYTSNLAIAITNTISPTSPISNFSPGDSVRLAWTISNSPCSPSVSYVSIKMILCPLNADFIADQTNFCGTNATVNFSDLSSVPGPNTIDNWSWSFPGGSPSTYTTTVASNPPPVTYTTSGTYTVSLTVTDNLLNTDTETKNNYITVIALPGTATTINGNTTVCQGESGVAYSVPAISGASTYTWTVPASAIINTGQGTTNITVDYGVGAVTGNISVTGQNSCGDGGAYNQAITVNNLPGATGVIIGPTSACQGASGVVFTVGAIAGSTGYNWTLPLGASIVGGANTNSVTVNFSASATDGTMDVVGTNGCGSGSSSSAYGFSIDSLPLPAGIISGNTTVCPGDTVEYNITSFGYASSYSWTLPSGALIIAGVNTETVTVAYGMASVSGNIGVQGVNACGNGTGSSLPVTVNPLPDAATAILGNSTVCAGSSNESYFISAINNASGYVWNLPSGFSINSGSNTNSILVDVGSTASTGTITVYGTNSCGDGVLSSFVVNVSPLPDFANSIIGSATVCQTQSGVVYTVPSINFATGYNWTLPLGANIATGANTNTITVDFSNTAINGFVTVVGTNLCGDGLSTDSLAVTVNPLPDPAGTILGDSAILICPAQTGVVYTIPSVANASFYAWTVPNGATIIGPTNTNTIVVDYIASAQTGYISVTPVNACGNGTSFSVLIDVDTVTSQSLCVITVDTTSTKNFLIWEKPVSTSIDSFRIYREISSVYTHIGSVAYSSLSEFLDNTNGVNPNITSYKYEVSAIDSCGNEGILSSFHRTMHLQIGPATPPASFNLSWNDYEGIPITQYIIMRDSAFTGWKAVDSVSFGNNAWTDINTYPAIDTISYYIEIDHQVGCTSSIKNHQPVATNLNSSRSNIYRVRDSTVVSVNEITDEFIANVYPNPSSGIFTLDLRNNTSGTVLIKVFNVLGEEVKRINCSGCRNKITIDLSKQAKGVYHLQVFFNDKIVNKKVVIE